MSEIAALKRQLKIKSGAAKRYEPLIQVIHFGDSSDKKKKKLSLPMLRLSAIDNLG